MLPLAGAELLALGAAFWICSRHAGDAETLTLAERELSVEHRFGRGVESAAFRAEWVRVEPVHGEGSLVEITGQGHRMRVGRYLRPELRMALAQELRQALRLECTRAAGASKRDWNCNDDDDEFEHLVPARGPGPGKRSRFAGRRRRRWR